MGVLQWFGLRPEPARRARAEPRVQRVRADALRSWLGASNDRLVEDLASMSGLKSANAGMTWTLRTLRDRSRHLFRNNEHAKAFLRALRNNVPGPGGFALQMQVMKTRGGKLDEDANDIIESEYAAFSKLGTFTACGMYSRAMFERAAIASLARDGEVLIEMLRGWPGNRYAFALRLLDPDLLDERLNVSFGGSRPDGARLATEHEIRLGVERDGYGRPRGYWLLRRHPGDDLNSPIPFGTHRRVPAEQMIHAFVVDELQPGSVRGVPPLAAAIRRMALLGGYEEAALVAARTGAAKMGFFTESDEGADPAAVSAVADAQRADGELVTDAEPGAFQKLPRGWGFESFDPDYPNDAMPAFVKHMLRAFAAGVGVSYHTISTDLEGVNYSSIRQGTLDDRDCYRVLQGWMRESIVQPIFEAWLGDALAMGAIGRLPAADEALQRFNKPLFIGRGWTWVDPKGDTEADQLALRQFTKSRSEICAERGRDFEDVLKDHARERDMAKTYGVELASLDTKIAEAPKQTVPAGPDGDDDE